MTPRSLLAPARLAGQPVLRTQSDERLVDLVRAGYAPAFEAIVARYRRPLQRYCARLLSDARAEDAVQQTFVSAYDAMLRSGAEINLRPWLYRIAHNTALNALRDRGLRHEALDEQVDGVERPDQALERREGLRKVVNAVQALPPRQRDALVLRELEGRSYDEIARQLGVTGGAVRQLLNRARVSLRAGASALTPTSLLTRIPWSAGNDAGARVAELSGGAGAGALLAKACVTALVTGAVVGGVAVAPYRGGHGDGGPSPRAADAAGLAKSAHGGLAGPGGDAGRLAGDGGNGGRHSGSGRSGSRHDGSGDDRSGHSEDERRSGDDDGAVSGDDHSGPGDDGTRSGSDDGGGRSGQSDGGESSGSGSGSGDDGDRSGSSSSGTGSSGTGSGGSGTGSSGTGSGGSGSGSAESGSGLSRSSDS